MYVKVGGRERVREMGGGGGGGGERAKKEKTVGIAWQPQVY